MFVLPPRPPIMPPPSYGPASLADGPPFPMPPLHRVVFCGFGAFIARNDEEYDFYSRIRLWFLGVFGLAWIAAICAAGFLYLRVMALL